MTTPILWVIAGPNGAGKTTLFNDMLRGHVPYVNADEIAAELDPAGNAIEIIRAGRLAVERRNAMVARRESLSIETTLAGSSALAFMRKAKATGYRISWRMSGSTPPNYPARGSTTVSRRAGTTCPKTRWCAATPTPSGA